MLNTRLALFLLVVAQAAGLFAEILLIDPGDDSALIWFTVFLLIVSVLFIVSVVLNCRRVGWSGWRAIAIAVPIVGLILVAALLFNGNEVVESEVS